MKTANFWSFYSTVIAVVFQVKQCGITRDQRNANKEIGKKKKKTTMNYAPTHVQRSPLLRADSTSLSVTI